jgi:hypothetical protein
MTKVLIVGLMVISFVGFANAAKPLVAEAPYNSIGDDFCVTLTSGTWSVIPPTANLPGRTAIIIGATPATMNGDLHFVFTDSSDTPDISTTTASHYFWDAGSGNVLSPPPFPLSDQLYLWGISSTDGDVICGVEFKQ